MPEARRLFLALWPEPGQAARWQAWADEQVWPSGTRRHRTSDLHLTLHFLGGTSEAQRVALEAQLPRAIPPLDLRLSRWQDWGGIAVLRPASEPPGLLDLQGQLGALLRRLGLPVEARTYQPHVTLARRAPGWHPRSAPDFPWRATRLVLAESRQGYHALWSSAG